MLGNAGGAKGPDFWCAFEEGEVKVLGEDRHVPRCRRPTPANERPAVACLAVKPVGKPDAGNRHVRFDERGWETGRWPKAPSYRAHPRLYLSSHAANRLAHSITSSARPRSVSGKVRPSIFAVLRLMTSSTFVDCWTGKS